MEMKETRKFTVSPHIIFSLIKAQAGTLGKAITECVMNSVDAQATKVHIELTRTSVRITDDGAGFQTRDEIESWFETLGFDHSDEGNHRAFGSFGIGRAQLWSFASTVWRTHRFVMDVDIKNKGLDYVLDEFGTDTPGLVIDGSFYVPLGDGQMAAIEQELRTLIKYVEVPVYLNGKNLCVDPTKETWDFETPEAWFKLDQSKKSQLTVYNMGVYVKNYWFHQYSLGGLVVTKPLVKLELNMARNDILVSSCKNWEKITKILKANSLMELAKPVKAKPTETDLTLAAKSLLSSDDGSLRDAKVFTDIRGRSRTLFGLVRANASIVCFADPTNEKAKRAHSLKLAIILKQDTLTRFGFGTAAELKAALIAAPSVKNSWYAQHLSDMAFFDTLEEALPNLSDQYESVLDKELEPVEKALLAALSKTGSYLARFVGEAHTCVPFAGSVRAGLSDKAISWCFAGDAYIDRRHLKSGVNSFEGFAALGGRIVHEFAAKMVDSNFTHEHDLAFYQKFHDMLLDPKVILQYRYGYQHFVQLCAKKSIDLPPRLLVEADEIL